METSEHPWGSLLFPSSLFRLSFWKDLPAAGEDGATADAGEFWENDQPFEGLRSDCAVLIGWPLCEVGLTGFVLKWKLMYVQGKAGQMLWMLGLWLMMASWSCGIRDSFWPIPAVVPRQVQIDSLMMSTPWCLPHNLPRWIYLLRTAHQLSESEWVRLILIHHDDEDAPAFFQMPNLRTCTILKTLPMKEGKPWGPEVNIAENRRYTFPATVFPYILLMILRMNKS